MAFFIRDTGSDLTPIQHSANIFKEYLKMNPYAGRMGKKGSGKPIIVDSSEFKGNKAGDTARLDRKSTRLNSSHTDISRMPSSA